MRSAHAARYSATPQRVALPGNPSGDLRGALPQATSTHFAATTEPAQLGGILRAMDSYRGSPAVVCAIRLAPLVFTRPGELRRAEWKDFDLDAAEWRYTVRKTRTPHIVPLSRQAVQLLRGLHPVTGDGRFVFPGARTDKRPMSDNAILAAMRRMGVEHGSGAEVQTVIKCYGCRRNRKGPEATPRTPRNHRRTCFA